MSAQVTRWLIFVVVAAGIGVFAYRAPGTRYVQVPNAPAVVATVNLEQIYDQLEERAAADTELAGLAQVMEDRRIELADRLSGIQADMEPLTPGTAQYRELEGEYLSVSIELRTHVDHSRSRLDREKGRILRAIYDSICDAADQLARQRGYDLVVVDDSVARFLPGGEADVTRQISARRVLYAAEQLDITVELINWMNNRFQAGTP